MHSSKLPLKTWGMAMYLLTTGIKGTSSMKLYRDLGVTQKTAWFLAHRIRKAWENDNAPFGVKSTRLTLAAKNVTSTSPRGYTLAARLVKPLSLALRIARRIR